MSDTTLRPFTVEFPEKELEELRSRIQATRWPDRETVGDTSQGVRLDTIQKLARHWASGYDWRRVEARLNSYPQFITEIDGLDIHFMHVRSRHEDALPLIVTHGWPGSVIEQLKIIGPLTDPTAYGAPASDAFHLVIPSMAGYGFSGHPTTTGWGPDRMARAWTELMRRLGYQYFAAQGGDWGAVVTDLMGVQAPPELLGIHTNMAGATPPDVERAAIAGSPAPAGLTEEEQRAYERLVYSYRHVAYAYEMGDRPQTLTGFADSPVALAAWMIDHDPASHEMIARSIDGAPEDSARTTCWTTSPCSG